MQMIRLGIALVLRGLDGRLVIWLNLGFRFRNYTLLSIGFIIWRIFVRFGRISLKLKRVWFRSLFMDCLVCMEDCWGLHPCVFRRC